MLAAACGSGTPPPPMTLYSAQEALITCIPAPDPGTITRWDSQIGYYRGIYYNHSSAPVTVESMSLLHPHNLTVHGAAVYKMAHLEIQTRRLRDSRGHVRSLTRRRLGAGRGGDIPRRRHDLHVNPDGRTCHRLGRQTLVLGLRRGDTLHPGLLEGTLIEPSSYTRHYLNFLAAAFWYASGPRYSERLRGRPGPAATAC
jgi:hypothetical protein